MDVMTAPDFLNRKHRLVILLTITFIGVGVTENLLVRASYSNFATAFFVMGYSTIIFCIWYVGVRPLKLGERTKNSDLDQIWETDDDDSN